MIQILILDQDKDPDMNYKQTYDKNNSMLEKKYDTQVTLGLNPPPSRNDQSDGGGSLYV